MHKKKSQYLVTAEQYLKKKNINFYAPQKIIISYSSKINLTKFKLIKEWKRGELYVYGNVGVLVKLGIGASVLNIAIEELFVLGTKEFIILGFAGAINPKLRSGDVIDSEKNKIYSTDDPYREETKPWFNLMLKKKYDAVDMETSALIKKGKELGIKTKSHLIIMDRLTINGWDDSYEPKKVNKEYIKLFNNLTKKITSK